jgi:hypothetical protein
MKILPGLLLMGGLVMVGCARHKHAAIGAPANATSGMTGTAANPGNSKIIVTAETTLSGKVVRVNQNAGFAVLNFPVGMMPNADQRMSVYRKGLKVGEVKVSGPRQDDNTVADIVNGEVGIGDELRSN